MPVIGHLDGQSPGTYADCAARMFRQGLKDAGYIEGENVAIGVYRWGREPEFDRLPSAGGGPGSSTSCCNCHARRGPSAGGAGARGGGKRPRRSPSFSGVGDDPVRKLVLSPASPGRAAT